MGEWVFLPEESINYLVEAVMKGIDIYCLDGLEGKPFVPNAENIRRVLKKTEIKTNSERMQFEIPLIVEEEQSGRNLNSHFFIGEDGFFRDFVLRRVCTTHITGYNPSKIKEVMNKFEKRAYEKFSGLGFGLGFDCELIGRASREELSDLLRESALKGYDYYLIGVWKKKIPIKKVFGGGDCNVFMPLCFFPGLDLTTKNEAGRNSYRDALLQFSKDYQLPNQKELDSFIERRKKLVRH